MILYYDTWIMRMFENPGEIHHPPGGRRVHLKVHGAEFPGDLDGEPVNLKIGGWQTYHP